MSTEKPKATPTMIFRWLDKPAGTIKEFRKAVLQQWMQYGDDATAEGYWQDIPTVYE